MLDQYKYQIAAFLIIVALFWKAYIPNHIAAGRYVNNNTISIHEGPKPIQDRYDTLTLFKDGTFSSISWGDGTYQIRYTYLESEIELNYRDAVNTMQISRPFFGKLKIWLIQDLGFYFKKID